MTTQTQSSTKYNGADTNVKIEDQLVKFSSEAGKKFGAMASDIADTTSEYIETGREYVKQNPAKGIAIAAGAGLVIGSLITMALKRK